MTAPDHTDYFAMAVELKRKYEDDARLYNFDSDKSAKKLREFEASRFRRDAIKALETRVLPRLKLAKVAIESAGLDAIIGRNWNEDGAALSAPMLRFQCASSHDALSVDELPVSSKVAVFLFDESGLHHSFEGSDADTGSTAPTEPFGSDEALVAWAVEQVVSSYYFELGKAAYLMPR